MVKIDSKWINYERQMYSSYPKTYPFRMWNLSVDGILYFVMTLPVVVSLDGIFIILVISIQSHSF